MPANGTAQSLQRGGEGRRRNTRRRRSKRTFSPIKAERTCSAVKRWSAMLPSVSVS